jgi:hypothetical protein
LENARRGAASAGVATRLASAPRPGLRKLDKHFYQNWTCSSRWRDGFPSNTAFSSRLAFLIGTTPLLK